LLFGSLLVCIVIGLHPNSDHLVIGTCVMGFSIVFHWKWFE